VILDADLPILDPEAMPKGFYLAVYDLLDGRTVHPRSYRADAISHR
jgi:hypothetical protein